MKVRVVPAFESLFGKFVKFLAREKLNDPTMHLSQTNIMVDKPAAPMVIRAAIKQSKMNSFSPGGECIFWDNI